MVDENYWRKVETNAALNALFGIVSKQKRILSSQDLSEEAPDGGGGSGGREGRSANGSSAEGDQGEQRADRRRPRRVGRQDGVRADGGPDAISGTRGALAAAQSLEGQICR